MKIAIALILTAFCASAQTNYISSSNWFAIAPMNKCGATYNGYISYTKTIAQGWGWKTNSFPCSATSTNGNLVAYLGKFGDTSNACVAATLPTPSPSAVYRFQEYFTARPTNGSSLKLVGFNP